MPQDGDAATGGTTGTCGTAVALIALVSAVALGARQVVVAAAVAPCRRRVTAVSPQCRQAQADDEGASVGRLTMKGTEYLHTSLCAGRR